MRVQFDGMWGAGKIRNTGIAALALLVSLASGCGRQPKTAVLTIAPEHLNATLSGSEGEKRPFERASQGGISPSESLFAVRHHVPAGTPITIRLQAPISSANSRPGDSFMAVLDEPIVVSGQTVAARGAAVLGRVVAARRSGRLHNPGYLRLALTSITVAGKTVPVQSSSIFVKGKSRVRRNWEGAPNDDASDVLLEGLPGGSEGAILGAPVGEAEGTGLPRETPNKDVGFGAERRLTFRLTDAVDVKG